MANQNPPTKPKEEMPYRITLTRDQFAVAPDGRLITTKMVYYETVFGDTGHVEIPKDQFSDAAVRALIAPEVDELLKLRGF